MQDSNKMPRATAWWLVLVTFGVLVAAATRPALATFAGASGKLAWTSTVDQGTPEARTAIVVDTLPISNPLPGENHTDPAWSPNGSKLVFIARSLDWGTRVETINADGTGRQVLVNPTLLGLAPPSSPVWSQDGRKIFFRIALGDTNHNPDRLYFINADGSGGLWEAQTWGVASDIDISSQGQLLYRQFNILYQEPNVLLWDHDHRITIPGQLARPNVDAPVWTAEGDVVFLATYPILENGQGVSRTEWFKIRRDATGLEQLTKAEDICPGPEFKPDFVFTAAAPSPDGDLIVLRGQQVTLDRYDPGTDICTYRYRNGLWSIRAHRDPSAPSGSPSGGPPRLVHEDAYAQRRPSWQAKPGGLVVKIDDGHGNPLQGLKVQIYDATAPPDSPPLNVDAENEIGGSYRFEVLFGAYRVRATLSENVQGLSAFDVRHVSDPGEPVWIEKTILYQFGLPIPRFIFDESVGASNVPELDRGTLDDMANIYYRTKQFVDWVRANLTPDTGQPVRILAFATTRMDGSPLPPGTSAYNEANQTIYMGTQDSQYAERDGSAQAQAPENGEWHEFSHHLVTTFVAAYGCAGRNHGGWTNPDTCDSMHEGMAVFLPTLAAQGIEGASDADYDGRFGSIERDFVAWEISASGQQREDFAVAALLWDLLDPHSDVETSQVIGTDGAHHPVTYQDMVSMPLDELWDVLTSLDAMAPTVYDLRLSFGSVDATRDLDGDGVADVAPIDEVFLMHGFYPVQGDQQVTATHNSYHFNVTSSDQIGLSSHDILNAAGTVTGSISPRLNLEADPKANVEVNVRDASGTPLEGATVRLTIDDSTPPRKVERRLHTGETAAVGLELPPYFSYVLPADAPELPPCDPLNDARVNVVVTARINGYDSADSFTFDNCAYWHAIEESTGSTALSFTMTFPEDAAPPASGIYALASVPPTNGATLGYWTLELSCSDPVVGGFASGCSRTEYRVNGGPLTPYTRVIQLMSPGQYLVEFRSLDAAANEEAFQSATYTVLPPQDSDGDGLPDGYEISIGTNPSNADTDGDGLRDDAEITRGTDPLRRDTDDDGLTDGAEVTLGTNPLVADSDGDGLGDGVEIGFGTNPLLPDTDSDGALDGLDNCRRIANRAQLDSDVDGMGDLCDNCPGAPNPVQEDADLDGAGDACDCAPADALVRAPASPTVVASKTAGTLVLSWAAVAGADDYAVTVGTRAGLPLGDYGACTQSTGGQTSFQSSQIPAPGEVLIYLVQGQSYACGMGSLGLGVGETPRANTNPAACRPALVTERRALSGTLVLGSGSGTYTDTLAADGVALMVTETLSSGGSPSSRFSQLEYRFTVNVATGQRIQLLVKGKRTNLEGEDFRFDWSTNGTTFTPVPMDSLPHVDAYDGMYRVGDLPPTLAGTVTLRVVDTDRSPGVQGLDWVWIDSLLVRSITP